MHHILRMMCCWHVASKELHVGSQRSKAWSQQQCSHNCTQLLTCALSVQGKVPADSVLVQMVSVALTTILASPEIAWLMF